MVDKVVVSVVVDAVLGVASLVVGGCVKAACVLSDDSGTPPVDVGIVVSAENIDMYLSIKLNKHNEIDVVF